MYQYFIVNDILNEKQINKLKKHMHHTIEQDIQILTDEGLYRIIDDNIYKFTVSNSIKPIKFEILDTSIIQQKQMFYKINKNIHHIPNNNEIIKLEKHIFKQAKESEFSFCIVMKDDEIINSYFLSNLEHTDFNFKEDISYFLRMLM